MAFDLHDYAEQLRRALPDRLTGRRSFGNPLAQAPLDRFTGRRGRGFELPQVDLGELQRFGRRGREGAAALIDRYTPTREDVRGLRDRLPAVQAPRGSGKVLVLGAVLAGVAGAAWVLTRQAKKAKEERALEQGFKGARPGPSGDAGVQPGDRTATGTAGGATEKPIPVPDKDDAGLKRSLAQAEPAPALDRNLAVQGAEGRPNGSSLN